MALTNRVTLEQYLSEPEEKPYREYLYGRVLTKAVPKRAHSVTQAEIARLLGNWVKAGAGGEVETEPRCILTTPAERHVQLPDVAWFSRKPQVDDN
ncbi:MAG: Uma2 family endonuclease, partial [Candidatus Xenobia bacterium]